MFQNYHKHSHYSNIILADSVATNAEYCKRAQQLGHKIISSCEHGTAGNIWECAALADKYDLKWRYVAEAYYVNDRIEKDSTNAHIILAAKTKKGIGDLNFALSEANISGFYYRPRVDKEILFDLDPRDVFVTTACVGGIFKYGDEEAERLIYQFQQHFRESFMLEVQYHETDKQKAVNRFLLRMNRKYGVPLIMGTDSHFILPEESILRDQRLNANNIHYEDEDGWYLDYPDEEEAIARFKRQGVLYDAQIQEAIENTNVFLTFEDVTIDKSKKIPNLYPGLTQEQRNDKYRELVYSQWDKLKVGKSQESIAKHEAGIQYEVDTITSTNMSDYFLVANKIVKEAIAKGGIITSTGRGSGVSYYTNTLLGFSSVDRFEVPVEMFPDRFISADRILSGGLPD